MNDTDTTYEGWSNHATWCVALHINNTQDAQKHAQELTSSARKDGKACSQVADKIWEDSEAPRYLLTASLKGWVESEIAESYLDSNDFFTQSLRLDLLRGYLAEVNWDELARSFLESEATK